MPIENLRSSEAAPALSQKKTLVREDAEERIENYMGHSYEMLGQMKEQTWLEIQNLPPEKLGVALEKLDAIYHKAESKLIEIETNIKNRRGDLGVYSSRENNTLSPTLRSEDLPKETDRFAKDLDAAHKEIAKVIQTTNIEAVKAIGIAIEEPKEKIHIIRSIETKIDRLAKGGIGGRWTRLMALVFATDAIAVKVFETGKTHLENAAANRFSAIGKEEEKSLTGVDRQKLQEIKKKEIDHRSNVIGINGIYSVGVSFSTKVIQKQISSFAAQHLSDQERKTITKTFEINGSNKESLSFTSKQTPLNKEFDEMLNNITNFFGKMFGDKGISSMNRREGHLINAYDSKLFDEGGNLMFDTLRHAITSEKFEQDPTKRKEKSEQAAKELITAAWLKEISSRGMTIEQAQAPNANIKLNLNSVSLVTPDIFRRTLHGQACERAMLEDQLKAFAALSGKEIELSIGKDENGEDIIIKTTIEINAFNFGVNQGAVDFHIALAHQYKTNVKAFAGLEKDVEKFLKEKRDRKTRWTVENLRDDIRTLMRDEKAYLEGKNQYEIGAKILILTNIMEQNRRGSDPGYQCATNCMSGKDRTGMVDGVAKAFAIMASMKDGFYPTHKQLIEDKELQKQFIEIFKTVLMQGGGLEITLLNTGAIGYKVGNEARLYNEMELHDYLLAKMFADTTTG